MRRIGFKYLRIMARLAGTLAPPDAGISKAMEGKRPRLPIGFTGVRMRKRRTGTSALQAMDNDLSSSDYDWIQVPRVQGSARGDARPTGRRGLEGNGGQTSPFADRIHTRQDEEAADEDVRPPGHGQLYIVE